MTLTNDGEILSLARKTILLESKALQSLSHQLADSFVDAVKLIHHAEGRLIVTGIGKSALIGQKLAATFNSMGTPAYFMHAGEAFHGDLGMLQKQDVLLCLSKSGETSEIKSLLPVVRSWQNPIIAMVANSRSYLAKQATVVIEIGHLGEADPHDLAPTTSSMQQLALGDALAITLAAMQDFQPRDFAELHPGGTLGKRMHLRVKELANRHGCPEVALSDPLQKVIFEISSKRLGATAVMDPTDLLAGIITDGDLRRLLARTQALHGLTASDVMTPDPKTIAGNALAYEALQMMKQHNITQLLVVEDDLYLGVVHIHDLLQEGFL
ncbi:MAG: KpsF/GutQ family sugar-phosphate isomerase [Saprospiraceae bacterium]|nr:KpsF/GutQ family sugar-phosphate isomerase [Saprospiraceae bacterium]